MTKAKCQINIAALYNMNGFIYLNIYIHEINGDFTKQLTDNRVHVSKFLYMVHKSLNAIQRCMLHHWYTTFFVLTKYNHMYVYNGSSLKVICRSVLAGRTGNVHKYMTKLIANMLSI